MIDIELLKRFGFKETFYPDQNDKRAFWTKKLKAREMPCVREQIANDDEITDDSEVVVEITPDGGVQMAIWPDYYEEPVPVKSEEGCGLLRDAGLPIYYVPGSLVLEIREADAGVRQNQCGLKKIKKHHDK